MARALAEEDGTERQQSNSRRADSDGGTDLDDAAVNAKK